MKSDKKNIDLFDFYLIDFKEKSKDYGRFWYNLYNLKYFHYNKTDKHVIKRQIKVDKKEINITLMKQNILNIEKPETRFLAEIDDDIFNYIIYKYSRSPANVNNRHYVSISMNEMESILGYNKKAIKQSLDLLSKYKIYFDSGDYEGVLPLQFLDGFVYDKKAKRTIVYLPLEMTQFIIQNKYILMNYSELFKLKNRIAKLLYRRINITNIMDLRNEEQAYRLPETVCNFLVNYGIYYNTRTQKQRLFEEIRDGLEELRKNKIIRHSDLKPIYTEKNIVIDYNLTVLLDKDFCCRYSMGQIINKELKQRGLIPLEQPKK